RVVRSVAGGAVVRGHLGGPTRAEDAPRRGLELGHSRIRTAGHPPPVTRSGPVCTYFRHLEHDMTGDLNITERVVRADDVRAAEPSDEAQERTIHRYGRISILAAPGESAEESVSEIGDMRDLVDDPTEVETLGLAAQRLRQSADYRRAKENRPRDGREW